MLQPILLLTAVAIMVNPPGAPRPIDCGVVLDAVGSVDDVIAGRMAPGLPTVSVERYLAGFEAGSPVDAASIGEFVAFNGVAYARSTRPGAERGRLLSGPRVISNGAVFLPRGQRACSTIVVREATALEELYARVTKEVGGPVCFVGTVLFETLHATAIGRAPIYGENVFANGPAYYPDPPIRRARVAAAIMGCAADLKSLDPPIRRAMSSVLYDNPAEPPNTVTAHTHLLETRTHLADLSAVTPAVAVNVHHAYSDSIVLTGTLAVYRIDGVRLLTSGAGRASHD